MNIGTQILKIRKEKALTQEEFGKIFHVTRQTVSNWENEKSYPDLQILIDIKCRSGSHGVYTSRCLNKGRCQNGKNHGQRKSSWIIETGKVCY